MTKDQAIEYIEDHFNKFEGTWTHQENLKKAIEILMEDSSD